MSERLTTAETFSARGPCDTSVDGRGALHIEAIIIAERRRTCIRSVSGKSRDQGRLLGLGN